MLKWNEILGKEVEDNVTGFRGIVVGVIEYFNGCIQYGIRPRKMNNDGTYPDLVWRDDVNCKVIGDGIVPTPRPTGGEMMEHPSER
jgi:hypothetical protein